VNRLREETNVREETSVDEGAIGGSSLASGFPLTTQWASVGAILWCGLVAALQLGKVVVFLPQLGSEFRLGLTAQGWLMGIFALMGAFGGAFAGTMDSRFDVKHVVLIGCLLLAAGSAAGSLATALTPLLLSRVLEGAGFLSIGIAAPALLQQVSAPKARYLILALWSMGLPVGMALVLLVGPAFDGWRECWVSTAVLAGISVVLVAVGVHRQPPLVRQHNRAASLAMYEQRSWHERQ
jgi:MFS family permease